MIDRLRRFAGGRAAVAAAFALHGLTLGWFVWRSRGEEERLYWEYGGRVLGHAYTAGYTDWVQHRVGAFPSIGLATIHAPYAAPYSGFACEYPPGALWLFGAIRAVADGIGPFSAIFHLAMAMCCAGTAWLAWRLIAARAGGAGPAALALMATWPLLTGPMAVMRFDPVAALLATAAIMLAARGRGVGAGFVAGLGAAVKIWPGLIVPFLCAMLWRSGRRGGAIAAGLAACAGLALPHLGMVALGTSPPDLLGYLGYLRDRPPEVESLTANLIALAARATGADIAAAFDFGSFNLDYADAATWTGAASLLNLALLVALFAAIWFTRDRRGDVAGRWLVLAAAGGAAACATIVCSRVFSSEYLIWLLPFAILAARTPGGGVAMLCYAGALLSLKIFYRFPEWPMGLSTRVIAFSLLRNLLVIGMGGGLAATLWRRAPLNSPAGGAMFAPRHNRIDPTP